MVNPQMVETIAKKLASCGRVIVQTDIEFLAEEMFRIFRESGHFQERELAFAPFPVKTERERAVESKEMPVYRREFLKGNEIKM
jgi:tRNA G46 methylase TrmB